jgi:hypothetical protein
LPYSLYIMDLCFPEMDWRCQKLQLLGTHPHNRPFLPPKFKSLFFS